MHCCKFICITFCADRHVQTSRFVQHSCDHTLRYTTYTYTVLTIHILAFCRMHNTLECTAYVLPAVTVMLNDLQSPMDSICSNPCPLAIEALLNHMPYACRLHSLGTLSALMSNMVIVTCSIQARTQSWAAPTYTSAYCALAASIDWHLISAFHYTGCCTSNEWLL
jgi:hypothetical protein